MTYSPADIVAAHQYLYYVVATPVWSDHTYDAYCRMHHIEGGGGSDRARDYEPRVIALAKELLDDPTGYMDDDGCI